MLSVRLPHALLSLALSGLLAGATPAVFANDTPADVVIGGTFIHVVRTSWAGMTPQQRADHLQQRLITMLSQGPISTQDITVGQLQGDWCVMIRGQRFLTADPLTVKEDQADPQTLANAWAAHLRQVLPDLTLPKSKPAQTSAP